LRDVEIATAMESDAGEIDLQGKRLDLNLAQVTVIDQLWKIDLESDLLKYFAKRTLISAVRRSRDP